MKFTIEKTGKFKIDNSLVFESVTSRHEGGCIDVAEVMLCFIECFDTTTNLVVRQLIRNCFDWDGGDALKMTIQNDQAFAKDFVEWVKTIEIQPNESA